MTTVQEQTISPKNLEHYHSQGFCLVKNCVPAEHLELLRSHCQGDMDAVDEWLEAEGKESHGINHKGKRYFTKFPSYRNEDIYDFIYSPVMESAVRSILGPDVFVFWEQYVVKGCSPDTKFAWHQDSGYVGANTPHKPYLTCWVALDDVTIKNGSVYILPYDRAGTKERVEHELMDDGSNDLKGYHGDDPGDPIECPAGSIAFFSSTTFHRSGPNLTDKLRRVYLIQYAAEDIRSPDGEAWGRSERFLADGNLVAERGRSLGDCDIAKAVKEA